jgi:hypothetical protein
MDILRVLRNGPANNAELQEATCDHAGSIARYCAKLIADGRIVRIDGKRGRGSRAVYAIAKARGQQ